MTSIYSNALSHVLVPCADTGVSSGVALFAAAEALEDLAFDKKLVFATFQAEKPDFVDSRQLLSKLTKCISNRIGEHVPGIRLARFVYGSGCCTNKMQSTTAFNAQLTLANISVAVILDLIGILPASKNFQLHMNSNANDMSNLLVAFVDASFANGQVPQIEALPPTPLLSFLNYGEYGKNDLVNTVFAEYDDTFSGQGMYNRYHDGLDTVAADAATQAAQVLSEGLYMLVAANAAFDNVANLQVNAMLVVIMFSCITADWTCDLMNPYSKPMLATMIEHLDLSESEHPSYTNHVMQYLSVLNDDRSMAVKRDSLYNSYFNGMFSDDSDRANTSEHGRSLYAPSSSP